MSTAAAQNFVVSSAETLGTFFDDFASAAVAAAVETVAAERDALKTQLLASAAQIEALKKQVADLEAAGSVALPKVSVSDATANEKDGTVLFTVSLDRASDRKIVVGFKTVDGTAKDGEDYRGKSGSLTFAPRQTEKQLLVELIDDAAYEGDETFVLHLTSSRIEIERGDYLGTGTIVSDDADTPPPPPPPPPTGDMPSAASTGAKGTLTSYTGPDTITVPNTVIKDKIVTRGLVVLASGFRMENCRQTQSDSFWGIDAETAGPIVVQDCTLVGPGAAAQANGILASGTIVRNDISQYEHQIVVMDQKTLVQANYLHDGASKGSAPDYNPHIGGVSLKGGNNDVDIVGNAIYGKDTSCIFLQDYFGPINRVRIEGNWCFGSETAQPKISKLPAYPIYVEGRFAGGTYDVTVKGNWLQKGTYGYFSVNRTKVARLSASGNLGSVSGQEPYINIDGQF